MTALRCVLLLGMALGCTQTHEVDLSRTSDFKWNGKVRVATYTPHMLASTRITSIELESEDGRIAQIIPTWGGVRATVDLPVRHIQQASVSQPAD